MKGLSWFVVIAFLIGCGPKEPPSPVQMGDAAPAFGSTPTYSDMGLFLEGMWGPSYGVKGEKYLDFYQFSADGTFYFSKMGTKNKIHGTWKPVAKGVWLTYERFDDEPMDKYRERIQREAETGSQAGLFEEEAVSETLKKLARQYYLELDDSKKELIFTDPDAGSEEGVSIVVGAGSLVRMTIPKEE